MIALQLLAQLVAPPLQPGPVRLPGSGIVQPPLAPGQQRQLIPQLRLPSEEVEPRLPKEPQPAPPPGSQPAEPGPQLLPEVEGLNRYSTDELRRILAPCAAIANPAERLSACAAALTTRLVLDGYVNSRVYPLAAPFPGVLEVVEGRIVEINITSASPRLTRKLQRLLLPLQGTVLHLPSLELTIQRLQQLPGIGQLDAKLNRLGGDSTRAVLDVTAEAAAEPLQGEVALRNDGNGGSGQFRGLATLLKNNLALGGDTLLVFGELDTDSKPSLGYTIGSISYSLPLGDRLAFTTAFGFSRRNLVEANPPADQLSFRQLQLLGQLEITLGETLSSRWSAFAGLSVSRSDAFLAGASFPAIGGGGSEGWLRTGFLRAGINAEGSGAGFAWSGSVYGLQGIAGLSTMAQLNSLASFGIQPGEARAIGGQLNVAWALGPRWQLQVGGAGQLAFHPLTGPMGFALGSDNGLRGLPGQVISGDSGLLGRAELSWSIWSQGLNLLQLVPFIGAGGIRTETPDGSFTDGAGAGGLLLRWLNRSGWLVELGWTNQFGTAQRPFWGDWLLGSGIYTKLSYRF